MYLFVALRSDLDSLDLSYVLGCSRTVGGVDFNLTIDSSSYSDDDRSPHRLRSSKVVDSDGGLLEIGLLDDKQGPCEFHVVGATLVYLGR
jgi:hypothetical protein